MGNDFEAFVHVVRRQHARARRRRLTVGVAVPAPALAVGAGLAFAGGNTASHVPGHTPSHTAVAISPPSAPPTRASAPGTTPHTSVPIKPASYNVVLRNQGSPLLKCPANATAPVGKSAHTAGVWFWTKGQCLFVGVGGADTKPGNATPLHIKGYPDLYSTLQNGVRTIYAPGHRRAWLVGAEYDR